MSIPLQYPVYGETDIRKDRAVGVLLPFNGNAELVDITKGYKQSRVKNVKPFKLSYTTEEQAVSNLVNLLLTRRGERLMQPDFGSPIPEFVFELNSRNNREDLKYGVQDAIEFWLPYINVRTINILTEDELTVSESNAAHTIVIQIEFNVGNSGANRIITIFGTADDLLFDVQ